MSVAEPEPQAGTGSPAGNESRARPESQAGPGSQSAAEPQGPLGQPASAGTPDAELRWERPSPRLLRVRRIQLGLVTVPLALVGGLAGASVSAAAGAGVALGVLLAGLVAERFLARRVAAWGFTERHEDLMVRRGVMVRRLSVIPYGRMQFIDVSAGPLERSQGLATLRMHTAAAASDARIPGLDQDMAARLRDQLAALGQAQAAGL
jgi:membrane protein YdbS with pleckstrin-like domain